MWTDEEAPTEENSRCPHCGEPLESCDFRGTATLVGKAEIHGSDPADIDHHYEDRQDPRIEEEICPHCGLEI